MNKQVKQYHESRRMFYIDKEGEIIFAPKGSCMSHSEWFESMEQNIDMNEIVRGTIQSNGVFFYIGDFESSKEVESTARRYYRRILKEFLLSDKTKIYAGVTKSKPGLPWKGKNRIA